MVQQISSPLSKQTISFFFLNYNVFSSRIPPSHHENQTTAIVNELNTVLQNSEKSIIEHD